jgi:hypothetical protein
VGAKRPRPVGLDTGGLIAVDRADRRVIRLLELAEEIHVPAAVLAQAWRNPARQVRLVRVLAAEPVTIHPLDGTEARAVGQLCVLPVPLMWSTLRWHWSPGSWAA